MGKPVESRFWMGTLKTSNGKKDHVFDADRHDGMLARCGTAHFENCTDREPECDKLIDLMIRTNPKEMCQRCRMSICFEIWNSKTKGYI